MAFVAAGHAPRDAAQIVAFAKTDDSAFGTFYRNFSDMVSRADAACRGTFPVIATRMSWSRRSLTAARPIG